MVALENAVVPRYNGDPDSLCATLGPSLRFLTLPPLSLNEVRRQRWTLWGGAKDGILFFCWSGEIFFLLSVFWVCTPLERIDTGNE